MNFWLLKTEPEEYSWSHLERDLVTQWTGVRNFEARNNMKQMQLQDMCFFYHTGKEKQIVGLTTVINPYYIDPEDERFGIVDIKIYKKCLKPLPLQEIKLHPLLQNTILLKRSRLSVVPISIDEFQHILRLTSLTL